MRDIIVTLNLHYNCQSAFQLISINSLILSSMADAEIPSTHLKISKKWN